MENLQIRLPEKNELAKWDYEAIKKMLADLLGKYRNTAYTDETIKTAKDDKAELGKVKKLIEDKRKAYKEQCLAPYKEVEAKIKELTDMIDEQKDEIDAFVNTYNERLKAEKANEVKAYYLRKATGLGSMAEPLFEKIMDAKWLNASTGKAKYQEEIQLAVNKAQEDIASIKELHSRFEEAVLNKYAETYSLEAAKEKHEELTAEFKKAGMDVPEKEAAEGAEEEKEDVPAKNEGRTITFYGTERQIGQILDFAKALGVAYEDRQVR